MSWFAVDAIEDAGALTALVLGILAGLVVAVFTIPFVLVGGAIVAAIAFPLGTINPEWLVPIAIPLALTIVVIATLVQIPVQTYLGYYALFVLGDAEATLDLIPEKRAAVRDNSTIIE